MVNRGLKDVLIKGEVIGAAIGLGAGAVADT